MKHEKFYGKTISELRKMSVDELKELLKNNIHVYQMFGKTCSDKGMLIMLLTKCKYTH